MGWVGNLGKACKQKNWVRNMGRYRHLFLKIKIWIELVINGRHTNRRVGLETWVAIVWMVELHPRKSLISYRPSSIDNHHLPSYIECEARSY